MKKLLSSVYEAIGETPMVNLSRITKYYDVDGNIFAKLEYLNPGFSKKDRPALQMIDVKQKGTHSSLACPKAILWKEHA